MQPRRAARIRATASNENGDENGTAATTRVTRAKAASMTTTTKSTALASKQTTTTTAASLTNRKRAALGDVSNVHSKDGTAGKGAKKTVTKTALAPKTATKTALAPKTTNSNGAKITRSTRPATKVSAKEVKRKEPVASSGVRKRTAPAPVHPVKKEEPEEEKEVQQGDKKEVQQDENENPVEPVKAAKAINVKEAPQADVETSRAAKRPRVDGHPKSAKKLKTASEVEGWEDLDAEDADDPLMVSEYVNEIFEYLKELEIETQPNPNYMDNQDDLKWKMRGILVDWLVEVHTRFRLLPETLFLAVNIVDRFLSNKVVMLDKLQLVGVAAMFVAAKYEEVFSPHVQHFRHVADDGFTEEEILRAERFVLATLDYNLSYPNPMNFLRRISKADQYDFQTRTFAKYLMEISLLDHRFLVYPPSQVAAASMYMSRMMLGRGDWDVNLVHYSDYTEEQIKPVFHLMLDYLIRPVRHEAFYKKYASKKFMKASLHARSWAKRNAQALGVVIDEAFELDA